MFFKRFFQRSTEKHTFLSLSLKILVVDLGDVRSFQKRSLNEPHKIRMNTCDVIMERKIFVFSLISSSFSLHVRAVRERHLGPLDSEK